LKSLEPGWDIVFIARPLAANADYAGLEKAIDDLLSRAQLLGPKDTVSQQRLELGVL
jgi:RNase P protein component